MERNENAAVVIGVGALLAGLGLFKYRRRHDMDADTETVLLLTPEGGTCRLTFKEQSVRVGRDRHIRWRIYNFCHEEVRVRVGNFRRSSPSAALDCSDRGPDWPFATSDRSEDVAPRTNRKPGSGRIKLRVRADQSAVGEYYYDICITAGAAAEVKAEPRMFVE